MTKQVLFGMGLPQVFGHGAIDVGLIADSAIQAERAGLHSVWTQSQTITVNGAATLDPLTLLSFVSSRTARVQLGVSVIVVSEHSPVQLAKQLASLDQLSAGRLIVGLGTGSPQSGAISGTKQRPIRQLLDTVRTLDLLWSGEAVTFEGELWQFEAIRMLPTPIQRPRPPLWIGGSHDNALRRAVRHGDGWMGAGASSLEQFAVAVASLRQHLDEFNRDPETFTIAKRLYIALNSNEQRARQRLGDYFSTYSRNPARAMQTAICGGESQVVDAIGRAIAAGAELVVLNPVYDHLEQQQALCDLLRTRFDLPSLQH